MSDYDLVIIGAGLSGLAAGIRQARFGQKVLLLEQHRIPGGLNSYYSRRGFLFETGLHAITNFARPEDRAAPLNRLLRQLKLKPTAFTYQEQLISEINFDNETILTFTNDFAHLTAEVERTFPDQIDNFVALSERIDRYDPFAPAPYISARERVAGIITNPRLVDMLFCPTLYYGSAVEDDIDFGQFVIMFRAVFKEGFFRIAGGIKTLLDTLVAQLDACGGRIRYQAPVATITLDGDAATGVLLENGETITARNVISTAGYPNTLTMLGRSSAEEIDATLGRLSYIEGITLLDPLMKERVRHDRTIIFFNKGGRFEYRRPTEDVDLNSGVICFPANFHGYDEAEAFQVRVTHLANYDHWRAFAKETYAEKKRVWRELSHTAVRDLIGPIDQQILYEDSFTPMTIERYTRKLGGAIYGSPIKSKAGLTPVKNCYLAGTDQGFLGIVGSMLSGVSMVNQHTLG